MNQVLSPEISSTPLTKRRTKTKTSCLWPSTPLLSYSLKSKKCSRRCVKKYKRSEEKQKKICSNLWVPRETFRGLRAWLRSWLNRWTKRNLKWRSSFRAICGRSKKLCFSKRDMPNNVRDSMQSSLLTKTRKYRLSSINACKKIEKQYK